MSNLIRTQKARTIYNIGSLIATIGKRYLVALLIILLLIALLMGIALFAWQWDNIKHYSGWNKAFSKNDKRFKVLLLPFKQLCDDKRDVGEVIKDRLEQLSKDDTLDMGVYYADISISKNFNDDSATSYMQYHRADFVIYGQYQDQNCTDKGKDEYCMNFQTSPEWAKKIQEKQSRNTKQTMQVGLLDDIRNGNLTVNVEFVLYYVAGKANYQKADFRKSVAYFTKVIKRKKGDALTYNNRGNAYRNLEQYDKAIADYNKAIALNPNDVNAYNNRGYTYWELNQYDKAIANCNKAIALDSNYTYAYNNRGNAYRELKQYDKAIADYNKTIALDSNYTYAYNNRGNAYRELKQYDKAIADYNKAILLEPNNAYTYNNFGNVYRDLEQYTQAIVNYDKAIELDFDNAIFYCNRGYVYDRLNQCNEAIADYNKVLTLRPSSDPIRSIALQALESLLNKP